MNHRVRNMCMKIIVPSKKDCDIKKCTICLLADCYIVSSGISSSETIVTMQVVKPL